MNSIIIKILKNYEYKAFKEFIHEHKINHEWITHPESFVEWNSNQVVLKII